MSTIRIGLIGAGVCFPRDILISDVFANQIGYVY